MIQLNRRSSLYYNTSARHERHECDTNDTSATRVTHDWNTSATRVTHECNTSDTSATRVKNFDFDNETSENIFSHPYISYIANEILQGKKQFHSKSYLLEMRRSHTKMRLKSAPQKLKIVIATDISKNYTLDCSCKCPLRFPA